MGGCDTLPVMFFLFFESICGMVCVVFLLLDSFSLGGGKSAVDVVLCHSYLGGKVDNQSMDSL